MKRLIAIGIILLFIGSVSSTGFNLEKQSTTPLNGKTLYVGGSGPNNYTKIQDAIDDASDGDTVFVYNDSSPYVPYEGLEIDKSINLIGEDRNTTIIKGGGYGNLANITANWVNISEFTIILLGYMGIYIRSNNNTINNTNINSVVDNGTYGLYLYYSSYNIIINNNISDIWFGIYLSSSNKNHIMDNSFFNSGIGVSHSYQNVVSNNKVNCKPLVFLENKSDMVIDNAGQVILINCDNFTIQNQKLCNTTYGIELWNSDNCHINRNNLSSNWFGIYLFTSKNTSIAYNNISSNIGNGLELYHSRNNTIKNNNIHNNGESGIYLNNFCNNTLISGNNISSNNEYGIGLEHSSSSTIKNNSVRSSGFDGIEIGYNSNYNIIKGNNISSNNWRGIDLFRSSYNTIRDNNIYSGNEDGIRLFRSKNSNIIMSNKIISNRWRGILIYGYSHNNIIIDNNVSSNGRDGIQLEYSERCIITDNNIRLNKDNGIYIYYYSHNNSIKNNNINSNKEKGIYLQSSRNNIIYHNNIINNTQNAYDESNNNWDDGYPSGGNYWSDYTGNDSDEDGIGDTPYTIPGGDNEDRYPLMEPWGDINRPYGPSKGLPGINYTFCIDLPDDAECEPYIVMWDWGDGTYSEWMGPYKAGETACATHSWDEPGDYDIRVKIRDGCGNEYWSLPFTITIVTAVLEIDNIAGGLFRVTVTIKNIGEADAKNVHWSITLEGGFILIGRNSSGGNLTILAGGQVKICSSIIIGYGYTKIIVKVWIPDGSYDTHELNGFVFLFFIKILLGGN